MHRFYVIVLAAGASSRLGKPKQALAYGNGTLLTHCTQTAIDSGAAHVLVVLGSKAETLKPLLTALPVQIVVNDEWGAGMSSSIRCGILALDETVECGVLTLADQPNVPPDHLRQLASLVTVDHPIAASKYKEGPLGVPSAFHRSLFEQLQALTGDQGARTIIRQYPGRVQSIPLADSSDIDTPDEYSVLMKG